MRCIDPKFFNLEMYAIYYSLYDLIRKDAWKIVWRSGEIVYNEIKNELKKEAPLETLKSLAKWLKKVGYIEDIYLFYEAS